MTSIEATLAEPSITATSTSFATTLELTTNTTNTTRIIKVGTINISNIGANGYTLTITSGNIAKSNNNPDNPTPIPFQVTTVPSNNSQPTVGDFTTSSGSPYVFSSTISALDLYIKYNPTSVQDPGNYGANINLSVADNP
ncbi:hypothetical protein [Calothrix sp. PCC 6303]|uniref:hypothetical protein n=1 Tax=Calothrix sp. PCC 6303 TaxID=1170562 RepID=UPI0002E0E9A5|nr:hypothetical protein [Calothrix sp. PCC 6303]